MKKRRSMWDLFQKQFDMIEKMMEVTMKEMFEELEELNFGEDVGKKGIKPKVYGIKINVRDGKVDVEEFGDVKPTIEALEEGNEEKIGVREPLTEVHDEGDSLLVVAELPGISEESIKARLIDSKTLEIKVDEGERRFYKKVVLPTEVENMESSYKNGILRIVLKKK